MLGSNREMRDVFRVHFCDRFALCPDLPVQEFRSYLADFHCLQEAEAVSCEGVVTECEVCDALNQQIARSGWFALEVYLRLPHMFVSILTDMFNHWFTQGAIPGNVTKVVTKGGITLLKKSCRHVLKNLEDYRPIILLNPELKT